MLKSTQICNVAGICRANAHRINHECPNEDFKAVNFKDFLGTRINPEEIRMK